MEGHGISCLFWCTLVVVLVPLWACQVFSQLCPPSFSMFVTPCLGFPPPGQLQLTLLPLSCSLCFFYLKSLGSQKLSQEKAVNIFLTEAKPVYTRSRMVVLKGYRESGSSSRLARRLGQATSLRGSDCLVWQTKEVFNLWKLRNIV